MVTGPTAAAAATAPPTPPWVATVTVAGRKYAHPIQRPRGGGAGGGHFCLAGAYRVRAGAAPLPPSPLPPILAPPAATVPEPPLAVPRALSPPPLSRSPAPDGTRGIGYLDCNSCTSIGEHTSNLLLSRPKRRGSPTSVKAIIVDVRLVEKVVRHTGHRALRKRATMGAQLSSAAAGAPRIT